MPIYDYRCSACDHLVEVIHGINDPGPRYCESCGAEGTMRKGFATPAVVFKGGGWARKERSSSSKPSSGSSSSGTSTGGSGAGGDGAKSEGASGATSSAGAAADD